MLHDHLVPAIQSYLDESGGGIATGMVCVVDVVGASGEQGQLIISTLPGQRTVLSLGMVDYARECFVDEAIEQIHACDCDEGQ